MSATFDQYENAEFVEEAHEQVNQKQREQRVETVENLGTKQWLQQSLEDQAKPIPVMGREFMFTPVGNQRVENILELASDEAAQLDANDVDDIEDVDEEHLEDMPKFVRSMRETLEEHCTDDYMATEGFKKVPIEVLQKVFEDLAMGGN